MSTEQTPPNPHSIKVGYTNYEGRYALRTIVPLSIWYGVSPFHKEDGEQWFLKALDIERDPPAERDFAMKDFGIPEAKVGQAYQVIGMLLEKCGDFEGDEGQRALDYFADERSYDDDFLPWPRGNHDEWMKLKVQDEAQPIDWNNTSQAMAAIKRGQLPEGCALREDGALIVNADLVGPSIIAMFYTVITSTGNILKERDH